MRGWKTPYVVVLTEEERNELNRWVRSTSMPAGLVRRARTILLVSEGKSLAETGHIVGMGGRIVRHWICWFIAKRIEGLKDEAGRDRKPSFPLSSTVVSSHWHDVVMLPSPMRPCGVFRESAAKFNKAGTFPGKKNSACRTLWTTRSDEISE